MARIAAAMAVRGKKTADSPARSDLRADGGFILPVIRAQALRDLGQDRRSRSRPGERAPMARPMGPWMLRQFRIAEAMCLEPLEPAGMGLLRAQRADIESRANAVPRVSAGSSSLGSWVSATSALRGPERRLLQRLVRPVMRQRHIGKAFGGGEGRARVDDAHAIAGQRGHARQRLGDMHRADDRQLERRIVNREKPAAALRSRPARSCRHARRRRGALEFARGVCAGSISRSSPLARSTARTMARPSAPGRVQGCERVLAHRSGDRLDEDLDLAAAGQPDLPGLARR